MRTRAAECGEELRLSVPGEYPCVRRFRYRRLLTFLWLQGYGYTFVAMLRQTNAYLCVFHLKHLVSQGQWTEALEYIIPRFLPRVPRSPPSLEARVLVKFLRTQRLFELAVVRHLDEHSLDRRAMWARAAEIVGDLANRTPEFRDRLLLPDGPMGPQHVLPIGFGFAPFRRRRHVKTHTRPTGKLARHRHTRRVAKLYFDKRMSLASCSHSTQELAPEIIAKAKDDWFRRIMEECVKAGTCPKLNQGCAPQPCAREGIPATGNVIKPECSSVPLATGAANRGPSMMRLRTRAVECGQELRLFVSGEYPCVRRFRYRRLLAFLWLQGYGYTFVAMLKQTNSYFCVFHLAHLVSQGQWTEALDYIIPRFLLQVSRSPPSLEARVLVKFLRMQRLFGGK
ncbi:hypothetical protein VPH35_008289 [Triticum aestivum]|uniref:Uncharacterized protein n=1 Tax=Triticum aestivum TaxID=4565 RepID=A0A3B5YX51_WHEAT